jgi:hypothetical protein
MARPLRIEYPGAVYHVTSRGNERGHGVRLAQLGKHLREKEENRDSHLLLSETLPPPKAVPLG